MGRYFFTKTIKYTYVTILVADKQSEETRRMTIILDRCFKDGLMDMVFTKAKTKIYREYPNLIPLKIIEYHTSHKVFGMTKEQFESIAVELDPKTRTPITTK